MVRKAEELAKKHGWFLARQFEIFSANPAYHLSNTYGAAHQRFRHARLDAFVSLLGHWWHDHRRRRGHQAGAPGKRRSCWPSRRMPALVSGKPFSPHKIQGWTPDFRAQCTQYQIRRSHRGGKRQRLRIATARCWLRTQEGIFCGHFLRRHGSPRPVERSRVKRRPA